MHESIHRGAGVYVVTLVNEQFISVNADRPAIAERCIEVNREHCKFGKALNLQIRRGNYVKTSGAEHVRFHPIAAVEHTAAIESLVAAHLSPYRMRGLSGRPNEWLSGISPLEVEATMLAALKALGVPHQILGRVPV